MNINNNAYAESLHKDNFQNPAQWSYISDNVMGGKSKGSVYYDMGEGSSIAIICKEMFQLQIMVGLFR